MARPRKPTALKILEGVDKRLSAVSAHLGVPKPPPHLAGASRRLWNTLAPRLDALRMLSHIDGMALEGVCIAYARAVEADRIIADKGLTIDVKTDRGHFVTRVRPEVAISKDCWSQVKSFGVEFGLTPASRSKLSIQGRTFDDDLETLLKPAPPGRGIQ